MAESRKTIWVTCASCGHQNKKHWVLHEVRKEYHEEDFLPPEYVYHRLVECGGCETIKYVTSEYSEYQGDAQERDFKVYPDAPGTTQRRSSAFTRLDKEIPLSVGKMYMETIDALNAGIRTLAGGGLRATVEAICMHSGIKANNLEKKIDELANQNLLTKAQADLLHEERYIGNAALHEMETPSVQDIEDGLEIVEGLMKTIYILPSKAERLKERREAKKSDPETVA